MRKVAILSLLAMLVMPAASAAIEEGKAKVTPWSGHWWPMRRGQLAKGYTDDMAPLQGGHVVRIALGELAAAHRPPMPGPRGNLCLSLLNRCTRRRHYQHRQQRENCYFPHGSSL